eukprot:gene2475-2514_t
MAPSPTLHDKHILLIIGGGIAAYKSLDLIRQIRKQGGEVTVVMTKAAQEFIMPLSAASLSGHKVYTDLFSLNDEAEMGHIQLSRSADLIVVAPATADLLAKQAQGLANDLASTLLLATDKRVLNAPAMNLRMWLHPATQRNVTQLKADGTLFIGPNEGEMACGEYGPGRMSEPLEIIAAIEAALAKPHILPLPNHSLAGKRVVITSGPTHEPIDPVRYIANRSSGKQGHALALAAVQAGAEVILVSGPVALPDPDGAHVVHVETAREMLRAVEAALPADIFIAAAAVADWRVEGAGAHKLKKDKGEMPSLVLAENPDILATIAQRSAARPRLVVGFAAETDDVLNNAKAKLARKGCDLIVANDVSATSGVMGGDANEISIITQSGVEPWPRLSKTDLLIQRLAHAADLPLPAYQTAESAGMDLSAAVIAPLVLGVGARALVPTGLQIALPVGFEAQVRPRSGLALKQGVTVLNSPGTIDADYRGEIAVILINLGTEPVEITRGMRIAQMVIAPVMQVSLHEVLELPKSERGSGGFGSTGTLAIAAVLDIALHARGVPVAAKALAGRFDVPTRHFETSLQALVKANILKGVRGPKGGYELARERRRISLADILRAIAQSDEETPPPLHLVQNFIAPALAPAGEIFMAELDNINIAQLCRTADLAQVEAQSEPHGDFTI